jgi:N-acyl-phosphatidylethanolamine-hydrolysing phospholipase D
MPIGSYCPRWHLRQHHCDPNDVVKMHLELGAKKTAGVHYATWILSDEHYLAPPRELGIATERFGVSESVIAGQLGRTMVIPWEKVKSEKSDSESDSFLELGLKEEREGKCVVWR